MITQRHWDIWARNAAEHPGARLWYPSQEPYHTEPMGNLSRSHDAIGSTGEGEEALADWIGRGMRWLHGHDVLAWQCVREFYKVKPWGKISLGRSARYDARRRGVAFVDGWVLAHLEPTTVCIDTCPDNQYGA